MSKQHSRPSQQSVESRHRASDAPVPNQAEQAPADQDDEPVPATAFDTLPLVGIGGSAGSIQALQSFFRSMATDSGMAFVVVLHLAPDHQSNLAEILQQATTMPVVQVNEDSPVLPDHIYVIPPGKGLAAMDGQLHLTPLSVSRGHRVAVDLFFRTLADTHGPHAMAIVLSGADGDGAVGIKREGTRRPDHRAGPE
jgi:two-component system CheB/CheR fusion protein